jgi:RNA polymerase sigma-70 factor (family 1)
VQKDIHFNEAEALLRLSHGDEASFAAIYNNYAPGLYFKLIKILKSDFLAEDILQDVFLIVWNNREKIDLCKCFQAYLSTIAVNKCYDHLRKLASTGRLYAKLPLAENYYPENDQALISKEESIVLSQTIELLPPKRKLIFKLCKIDGKTYEEVSNQLGISVSTISDHIVKANTFIRSRLYFSIT